VRGPPIEEDQAKCLCVVVQQERRDCAARTIVRQGRGGHNSSGGLLVQPFSEPGAQATGFLESSANPSLAL